MTGSIRSLLSLRRCNSVRSSSAPASPPQPITSENEDRRNFSGLAHGAPPPPSRLARKPDRNRRPRYDVIQLREGSNCWPKVGSGEFMRSQLVSATVAPGASVACPPAFGFRRSPPVPGRAGMRAQGRLYPFAKPSAYARYLREAAVHRIVFARLKSPLNWARGTKAPAMWG